MVNITQSFSQPGYNKDSSNYQYVQSLGLFLLVVLELSMTVQRVVEESHSHIAHQPSPQVPQPLSRSQFDATKLCQLMAPLSQLATGSLSKNSHWRKAQFQSKAKAKHFKFSPIHRQLTSHCSLSIPMGLELAMWYKLKSKLLIVVVVHGTKWAGSHWMKACF